MLNALPHIRTHLREMKLVSSQPPYIVPRRSSFGEIATRIPLPKMTSQKHMSTLLMTNTIEGGGMPHIPPQVDYNWEIEASLNMGPIK
jgi:hypothetical protein